MKLVLSGKYSNAGNWKSRVSVELDLAFDLAGQFWTDYLREGIQLLIKRP
jgi:hypothetical protein